MPNLTSPNNDHGRVIAYALNSLLLCLISADVLSVLVMSLVPPFMRDELIHHLAVPKLWIARGGIHQIPYLISSYYPMNLDLLYLIPLYLGNDTVPKLIHFSFGLSTAWLIYLYLKNRMDRWLALLGALLFLLMPMVLKLSISAYVDLGLTFFSWASIYFLFRWREDTNKIKFLSYSAVFCGLGLGTKYNGLIVLLILTMLVPILFLRSNPQSINGQLRAVRHAAFFCLIALVLFSPWMIKNYIWTGNPVYPLYEDKINNENKSLRFSIKPLLQRKLLYGETPVETLLIPVRIFFEGKDDDPKYFDGKLNPFLLVFAFVPIFLRIRDENLRVEQFSIGFFALVFLLIVFFTTDMRIRYIVPILPPLVVLAIFGLRELICLAQKITIQSIKIGVYIVLTTTVIFMFAINGSYLIKLFRDVDPLPLLSGKISKEVYLEKRLPEFAAIQFANKIHRKEDKILGMFAGRRGYYFNSEVIFMMNEFKEITEQKLSGKSLKTLLNKNKFTHVFVGIKPFERWVNNNFNETMKLKVNKLFHEGMKLIYKKNGYALFEVIEP